MPADFGDITAYHREEAARHFALAQAARDRDSLGEAEYHAGMAARWYEASQEQEIAMREPEPVVRHIAYRKSNYRAPEPLPPRPASFPAALLSAFKRMVQAIVQSLTGHDVPTAGMPIR
ncbi:MAG: hypothetical protein ABSD72_16030 [Terracidiphilus sp.]|jgi:hypothetical protein